MPSRSPFATQPAPAPRPTPAARPALRLLPPTREPLSATRIGANSATLALHLLVLGLLLAPPAPLDRPTPAEAPAIALLPVTPIPPPRPTEAPPRIDPAPRPAPPRQATRQPPLQERGEPVTALPTAEVPDDAPIADAPPAPTTGFDAPAHGGPSAGLRPVHAPPPRYPRVSIQRGSEGTVLLRVRVNADGLPEAVVVERSSGDRALDRAARAAVEGWRFEPTRRGGVAVASEGLLPVEFSLDR